MTSPTPINPQERFITSAGTGSSENAAFWSEYDKLADAVDKDTITTLSASLDSLLIFVSASKQSSAYINVDNPSFQAGLFSAVNSTVLFYAIGDLSTHSLASSSQSAGSIRRNTFFAASLATSLFAAFGAVLAKQWLLNYSMTGQVGELEQQCRKRQKKFAGAERWHLQSAVEFLPTVLQISLLIFFIGLVDFFWSVNTTVAAVVTILFGVALIAYAYFLIAGARDPDCPFQHHATQPVQRFIRWTIEYCQEIGGGKLPKSHPKAGSEQKKEEGAELQRDCVVWTLVVADKKESLLEAARSIPSLAVDTCLSILKDPAYDRLRLQLNASLRSAKTSGDPGKSLRSDTIVFGRALIWILLPTAANSQERRDACDELTRSWSGDVASPIVGFDELALIALAIDPLRSKAAPFDYSTLPLSSIPLYIICLVATDTTCATETVVRDLISTCLKATEIPILHVLVSAWALRTLAAPRVSSGRSALGRLRGVYKYDPDVATQLIRAIEVLQPGSSHESDCEFLEVVSTLIKKLTKSSDSYDTFTEGGSRWYLIKAIEPLTLVKEPLSPLRTAAIKVLNALSSHPDLNFQMVAPFHSLRANVFDNICANIHLNQEDTTTIEFLQVTSEFAAGIRAGTEESEAFLPYSNRWLRAIADLRLPESRCPDVSQLSRICQSDPSRMIWSLASEFLQTIMNRLELAAFWDVDIICRVLSYYDSLSLDVGTAGSLMLPILKTWSRSETGGFIDREYLRAYPEVVKIIVAWMKAQPEDLWLDSLIIVDHWSENWFDHDEDGIHKLFIAADFAEAVVAPWKSGTSTRQGAYEARNRIVAILSQKLIWREDLILAFNRVAATDGRLGGVKKVHKSLEREMIWRIASIVVGMPQLDVEPMSSAIGHLIPLLGHLRPEENPEEDRTWLKRFPDTVRLFLFALRQSDSVCDHALETLAQKSPVWFDHAEEELHQIFIRQNMAQALVECESPIEENSSKRNKILGVLSRSPLRPNSFHHLEVLEEGCGNGVSATPKIRPTSRS
ncbi:hypothetical protein FRB94_010830 [Tulasnella sp. JGI-2019a]|nr:hypothetical protein FRB94_010830 [Tulasnella sp. JGI-2019a]